MCLIYNRSTDSLSMKRVCEFYGKETSAKNQNRNHLIHSLDRQSSDQDSMKDAGRLSTGASDLSKL